jgi:hypothetical protein
MYKPIILPLAKEDIKEVAHWYNVKKKGLGKRFAQIVRAEVKHVCNHPKAVAIRYDKTRCAVLNVFPFMLHYTLDEKQKKGNHFCCVSYKSKSTKVERKMKT